MSERLGSGSSTLKLQRSEVAFHASGYRYLLADIAFLTVCVLGTTLPWSARLGFYADDWPVAQWLQTCPQQDTLGLTNCIAEAYRPLQFFETAVLYKVFGLDPLGYHAYNAVLLLLVVLALYTILNRFHAPASAAISVPLLYAFLPHFSTDRLWAASLQAALSVLFYLAAVIAARQAVAGRHLSWGWITGALAFLVLSVSAYEVAVPLFLLIPLVVWPRLSARQAKMLLALSILLVCTSITFKLTTQTRHHFEFRFLRNPMSVVMHTGKETWKSNYGEYGLLLPFTAWRAAVSNPQRVNQLPAVCLAAAVFAYLLWRLRRCEMWPPARSWLLLAVLGLVLFLLGYSMFAADVTRNLTTTGVDNRTMIAAVLGTAISLVAIIGLIAAFGPHGRSRPVVFSAGISLLTASGFVILTVITASWSEAAALQREVIAGVTAAFPTPPAGKVLIIDGMCAWNGPGIIFESADDVSAMLRLIFRNPSLTGDIRGGEMRLGPDGIHKVYYGKDAKYEYSDSLLTLDLRNRTVTRLADYQTARSYFERHPLTCPSGRAGDGYRIF